MDRRGAILRLGHGMTAPAIALICSTLVRENTDAWPRAFVAMN